MAPTFVFLLLFTLSAVAAQQRSSNISLGSSLSPSSTNSSWLSSSGRFAFGFYPQGNGFAIGIWFVQIPQHTVVWTANPDNPPLSNYTTLQLYSDGSFLLETQGQVKEFGDFPQVVSWASMLDTGNFVLYESSREILCQSFACPTNTLLPRQRLLAGHELFSSKSKTDHSNGRFRLMMQNDGNLVQYPTESPDTGPYAYWGSGTNTYVRGDNVTLMLKDDGRLYLFNSTGATVMSLYDGGTPINRVVFYRMTIDVDGIFRVYSIGLDHPKSNWSIEWESSDDKCDPMGICGSNAYCTLMEQRAVCNCIPGFNFIDESDSSLGCQALLNAEGCGNGTQNSNSTSKLENIKWEDRPYSLLSYQTREECENACLADSNCDAAFFTYLMECKKLTFPLRYGRLRQERYYITFVKACKNGSSTLTPQVPRVVPVEYKGGPRKKGILIISLAFNACAFIVLAFSSILVYQFRVWAYKKISDRENNIGLVEEIGFRSFAYDELEKVTEGFKEELGRGAFSTVFKGTLSNGRRTVAVKRVDKVLDEREREFQTEMRAIAKTHHRNLVQFLGYCCDGPNRLLVYEYMSNGSLADFLFKSKTLPCWHERVEIALNIARGILYLHEERDTQIIHCDIKPQNILMDESHCPKIADFGLSKLLQANQTRTETRIRGTRGYLAPEWHRNLPITVKVDIYSYGVVLLEILFCRKSIDLNVSEEQIILTDWIHDCLEAGELGKLVGEEEVDKKTLERMISIAIWCIQDEPSLRPSIKKVVFMLKGTIEVPIPPKPTTSVMSAI